MSNNTKERALNILEENGFSSQEKIEKLLIELLNSNSKKIKLQSKDGKSYTFWGRGHCNLFLVVIESEREEKVSYSEWIEIHFMSDH